MNNLLTKKILMAQGYSRENAGYPCRLYKSAGKNLKDYKVYGNSVQDGTPTPENPIEILSLGENSKNLFDVLKAENGTIRLDNGKDYNVSNRTRTNYIYLKEGTYTLSIINGITFGGNCHMYSAPDENTWLGDTENTQSVLQNGRVVKNATVTQDCYVRFVILPITGSAITDLSIDMLPDYKPMIEEGLTPTEYKPYKYVDVFSTGKNILPDLRLDSYWRTGDMPGTTTGYAYRWVNLKDYILGNNAQVTFSYDYSTVPVYFYMCSNDPDLTRLPDGEYKTNIFLTTNRLVAKTKTFIFNENYDYIIYSASVFSSSQFPGWLERFTYFQVEYNSLATDYEPYQAPITTTIDLNGHEPLRKIGNVADYIDYKNKKIIRNVGKVVLNGRENLLSSSVSTESGYYAYIYNMTNLLNIPQTTEDNMPVLCSHYQQTEMFYPMPGNKINTRKNSAGTFYLLYFCVSNSTIANFKSYLATQYANGTPVTVYYQLPTPIEESFDSPTVPTVKKTCVLTASDEIMIDSCIWSRYLSSVKENYPFYLVYTGTQYINTSYFPSQNTNFTIKYKGLELGHGLYASNYSSINNDNFSAYFSSDGAWMFDGKSVQASHSIDTIYTSRQSKDGLYINDNLIGIYGGYNNFISSSTLRVGVSDTGFIGNIYYWNIEESGILMGNFLPTTDYNNTACMWDTVTQKYFYNTGTGSFVLGQEV